MTKPLSRSAAIRKFIRDNPGATPSQIKEAIAGGDQRIRNAISAVLSQELWHKRIHEVKSHNNGLLVRRFFSGPPPRSTTAAEEPDAETAEPIKPAWRPEDVQVHKPEVLRAAPAMPPPPVEADGTLRAGVSHVMLEGGLPALQIIIPVRDYIDLLRRYR